MYQTQSRASEQLSKQKYQNKCTGCPTKHDPHGFCLISLATNRLESWDIIYWKDGIHSFVWSTKTFLYTQIVQYLNILRSDTPF